MLAALAGGADPLCRWFRSHLALRGVSADSLTKKHLFKSEPLPEKLTTTHSFRQALAKAQELCPNQNQQVLDVRHFMAAYAVIPSYHLRDFLRFRIDRRAWCIGLAEHLASRFEDEEKMWLEYARGASPMPLLGFNTDAPEGRDLLNIDREVEAFARLIASRNTTTPLSVGVFGAWGSGKSFFMRRLQKRVADFAELGRDQGAKKPKFHGQIAQIEFNAWHYSEGNLAASFVDHILRNLRVKPDETAEILKARSDEIVKQLDSAKQEQAVREKALTDAEDQREQVRRELAELNARISDEIETKRAEIATARSDLSDAQDKLGKELTNLQNDINEQVNVVPARAVATSFLKRLNNTEVARAAGNVRTLLDEAQKASANRKLIVYGLIVLAIAAIATAVMRTNLYTQLVAIIVAVGGLAGTALTWLKKLNALADSGAELQGEENRLRQAVIDEVTAEYDSSLAQLRAAVDKRSSALKDLSRQLQTLQEAPATARLQLDTLDQKRADLLQQHAAAAAVVEKKQAELAKLTTGTLLDEFLDERVSQDGYLKQLSIFSRIRNDFERLSDLMTKANLEYVGQKDGESVIAPPPVSRIVLYIDDLDRCSDDRVVEVLKLVHLLLAFPLFVCVVAVDPRWVTRCLNQAPGLIQAPVLSDPENRNADELGVPATATDYLEKIFQIPLWLRPIPLETRGAIARTLLDPTESPEVPTQSPDKSRFDLQLTLLGNVVATDNADPEGAEEDEADTSIKSPVDPDVISDEELQFLGELGGLLDGNPRSLKRFVNTYRLVKTALSDVELAVFIQSPGEKAASVRQFGPPYAPYRICMAQLAVLCTQRSRALPMVQHADQTTTGKMKLADWLAQAPIDQDLADRFCKALKEDMDKLTVDTFKLWLERTRRYSFYL
jgi:septal ring factor EnvC (AmiA/AmiB activator)